VSAILHQRWLEGAWRALNARRADFNARRAASVGRSAERQDNEDWLDPKDEHAVPKGEAQ
jgi:hypothetical protein